MPVSKKRKTPRKSNRTKPLGAALELLAEEMARIAGDETAPRHVRGGESLLALKVVGIHEFTPDTRCNKHETALDACARRAYLPFLRNLTQHLIESPFNPGVKRARRPMPGIMFALAPEADPLATNLDWRDFIAIGMTPLEAGDADTMFEVMDSNLYRLGAMEADSQPRHAIWIGGLPTVGSPVVAIVHDLDNQCMCAYVMSQECERLNAYNVKRTMQAFARSRGIRRAACLDLMQHVGSLELTDALLERIRDFVSDGKIDDQPTDDEILDLVMEVRYAVEGETRAYIEELTRCIQVGAEINDRSAAHAKAAGDRLRATIAERDAQILKLKDEIQAAKRQTVQPQNSMTAAKRPEQPIAAAARSWSQPTPAACSEVDPKSAMREKMAAFF